MGTNWRVLGSPLKRFDQRVNQKESTPPPPSWWCVLEQMFNLSTCCELHWVKCEFALLQTWAPRNINFNTYHFFKPVLTAFLTFRMIWKLKNIVYTSTKYIISLWLSGEYKCNIPSPFGSVFKLLEWNITSAMQSLKTLLCSAAICQLCLPSGAGQVACSGFIRTITGLFFFHS